jgi:hypothetical protein
MGDHLHVVIIGGQRCGSTLLAQTLDRHPEIASARPTVPEPRFFLESSDHDEYHRRHFPTASAIYVEKSTTYLERPECIENMVRMPIDVITVAILRDPVARAISNWRFSTASGLELLPADEALTVVAEGRAFPSTMSTSPYRYLARSRYSQLLDPWLNSSRVEAPEILLFEQLLNEPTRVLERLKSRLGLTAALEFDPTPVNAAHVGGEVSDDVVSRLRMALLADASHVGSLVPQAARYWPTLGGSCE